MTARRIETGNSQGNPLAQRRQLETYGQVIEGGNQSTLKKLIGYLETEERSTYQMQSALYVLGYRKEIGHYGPDGDGIDGKLGKNTRKAFNQFMKREGLTNVEQAYDRLLQKSRKTLISQAKAAGWSGVQGRLMDAGRSFSNISSYKGIYQEMTTLLNEDSRSDPTTFRRTHLDFIAMTSRMGQTSTPKHRGITEKRLLRQGIREIYADLSDKPYRSQLENRVTLYRKVFQELKDTVDEDTALFTESKRLYYQISVRWGISKKTIKETLRYFQNKHEAI